MNISVRGSRHRYIGFTIKSDEIVSIQRNVFIDMLKRQCRSLFQLRCNDLGVRLIRFSGNQGIVKCFHDKKTMVVELLDSIKSINGVTISVDTVGCSGTISSLIRKHM